MRSVIALAELECGMGGSLTLPELNIALGF
jgi:hypothetical protein